MATGDLPAFNDQTPFLVSRMNKACVISGSGSYLNSLSLGQFKLLHCTSTGSGFTIDHLYLVKGDGTAALDLSGTGIHYHSGTDDGGSNIEIGQGMSEFIERNFHELDLSDNWTTVVSGTGSVEEHEDASGWTDNMVFKLLTGSTSASTSNVKYADHDHGFNQESGFIALIKLDQTTDIASRWGYYMDNLSGADTNIRRHGFSQCTSVNQNWFGNTANGSSRSESDMGYAISTSTGFIQSWHTPQGNTVNGSPNVQFFIAGDIRLTKTNDIPTAGTETTNSIFRVSLKNNTANAKTAWLFKLKLNWCANNWWGSGDMGSPL